MSKIMSVSLAAFFVLNINMAQGAFSGTTPQSSYSNSSNQMQNSSIQNPYANQNPYGSQNPSNTNSSYYNQNPASNPAIYDQQSQGNNPAYYDQQSQGNNPNYYYQNGIDSNSNSPIQQTIPSTLPQTNVTPYNSNPNSINPPQANNWRGSQSGNYNQISESYDNSDNLKATSDAKYPLDAAVTDNDRQINSKIRERISGWFKDKYKNVSLKTSNGVVTLIGIVNDNDDLQSLIIEVRKVDGIRNVNNNVEVAKIKDTENSSAADSKYPQDRAATDADIQLNAKIRDKISGWFTDSYKNISLATVNGVVTVSGVVNNKDDLQKLVSEVRKVEGVKNLINDVQVAKLEASKNLTISDSKYPQDRAATDTDRQLNAKIRDKISGWFINNYKNISLTTEEGDVTLNGFVSNIEYLTNLQKEIRKIDGVRNINNNVQVKP